MATFFLLLIYITFISLGLPDSLLGAAWPAMRMDFGLPLDMAGWLAMLISGATIVSSLFSEKAIRRFGTGKVTAFSVLLTAVSLLFASFAQNIFFFAFLSLPLGLGAGAIDSALNNYVATHYAARHMNWLHSFWGVGAFTGPLIIGGFLRQNNNWRGAYFAISGFQLAVALLLFVTLPLWKKMNQPASEKTPPPQDETAVPQTDVLAAQTPAQSKTSCSQAAPTPQTEPSVKPASAASVFALPGVSLALITFLIYCAAEYTVGLWGTSYLYEARGFTQADSTSASWLFYLGITVGRFLSGFVTFRISSSRLIWVGFSTLFAGALVLFLPLAPLFTLVAMFVLGVGCAPVFPGMIHETPRRFGKENSQKIVGYQMAASYIGSTFVPLIVGLASRYIGIFVVPFFILLYAIVMPLLYRRVQTAAPIHEL